jgi:hypothetical protein
MNRAALQVRLKLPSFTLVYVVEPSPSGNILQFLCVRFSGRSVHR